MNRKDHQQNRRSWNAATRQHRRHRPRQAEYLANGGSTLFEEERRLLGEVAGKRLAHLQCNAGQDTLSLAALGADCLGVDISDAAIDEARHLSRETSIEADFVRADIYDWLAETDLRFDLAFSSYGVLPWVSDLGAWADGIRRVLKPGGAFVLVEFHPAALVFDPQFDVTYPYGGGERVAFAEGVGDYVGQSGDALTPGGFEPADDFDNPHASVEYAWSIAETVQALVDAGLTLERLAEWPHVNGWQMFEHLVPDGERRWTFPNEAGELPLMFGLRVRR